MAVQYYADSDSNGNITAYYNDDVWDVTKVPKSAIKITDTQWQDSVNNQGKYIIKAGAFVLAPSPTTAQQLASAQTAKIAELNVKCNTTILAGFSSTALGASHNYDFDTGSQQNLMGRLTLMNANANYPASFLWKTTDAGNLTHTKAQFIQLCTDADTFKNTQIQKYWNLKAQVNAATTVASVNAIVW